MIAEMQLEAFSHDDHATYFFSRSKIELKFFVYNFHLTKISDLLSRNIDFVFDLDLLMNIFD